MRAAARVVAALVAASGVAAPAVRAADAPEAAAKKDWKAEFEEICAKTQDAMTLETDELRSLVARCDALKPVIAGLDESQRKVYARRLETCRNLYQFVLDYKQQGKS
jgi:hypothetical protein